MRRTRCDTQTSHEVIGHRPDRRLPLERRPVRCHEAIDGNTDDERHVQPVDMLVPIPAGDGFFCDVRFLGIVLLGPQWLGRLGHARRRLRSVLWGSSHG